MRNALTYSLLLASVALASAACSDDKDNNNGDGGFDGGITETGGTAGTGGKSSTGGSAGSSTGGTAGSSGGSSGAANGGAGGRSTTDGGTDASVSDAGDASADGGVIALSDAQILDVIDVANAGEITQGGVGETKAQSPDVKAFATEMVTAHTAARTADMALAKQLGLKLAPSTVTANLSGESGRIVTLLNAAAPASFDAIYMDSQVKVHRAVLLIIDTALIPQAQAPALKTFLTTTRATVAAHLQMAESLVGDGGASRDQ